MYINCSRNQNVSMAAQKLLISQPTISLAINGVENQLGISCLFYDRRYPQKLDRGYRLRRQKGESAGAPVYTHIRGRAEVHRNIG
ncbi:MAG: LysR family transcriptional regulator [Christensenellales bacterium]